MVTPARVGGCEGGREGRVEGHLQSVFYSTWNFFMPDLWVLHLTQVLHTSCGSIHSSYNKCVLDIPCCFSKFCTVFFSSSFIFKNIHFKSKLMLQRNLHHDYLINQVAHYTCQLLLTRRCEIFILGVPGLFNTTQLNPKISEDSQRFLKIL